MNITGKLSLASILALLAVGPGQAQNLPAGDYYAPGRPTAIHATAEQVKVNQQGDFYIGHRVLLSARRIAALKTCTEGMSFASDRYLACMSKAGEAP